MEPGFLKELADNKDAIVAIAALGALAMTGLTAIFSLFGTLRAKYLEVEMKRQDAVRKLIESDMVAVGEAMHETLASATILVKKFGHKERPNQTFLEDSIAAYKKKIDESKAILLSAKTEYRYKFHGLEDGLAAIARAADWVKGLRDNQPLANRMLEEADAIRVIVDDAIVRAYRDGMHTTRVTRLRIRFRVWRLKRIWDKYKISGRADGAVV